MQQSGLRTDDLTQRSQIQRAWNPGEASSPGWDPSLEEDESGSDFWLDFSIITMFLSIFWAFLSLDY